MGELISTFYKDLYTPEGTDDMASVLDTVPTKVTPEMNDQLLHECLSQIMSSQHMNACTS